MSKSNQWAVGDKILCVDDSSDGYVNVRKGEEYIIDGFTACIKCGNDRLYLQGLTLSANQRCSMCSNRQHSRESYARSRFIRPDLDSLTNYKEQVSVRELAIPKELKELSNLQNQ